MTFGKVDVLLLVSSFLFHRLYENLDLQQGTTHNRLLFLKAPIAMNVNVDKINRSYNKEHRIEPLSKAALVPIRLTLKRFDFKLEIVTQIAYRTLRNVQTEPQEET